MTDKIITSPALPTGSPSLLAASGATTIVKTRCQTALGMPIEIELVCEIAA